MTVSRETLFEEVWTEPMTTVAAKYGVSPFVLGRACDRMRVPRPSRGYWALSKVGKAGARPPLPEAKPGDELEWVRDGGRPRTVPFPAPEPPLPDAKRVPRRIAGRHPLIDGVAAKYQATRKRRWLDHGFLRPNQANLPDIFVTSGSLNTALDTANALYIALERRGYRVELAPVAQGLRRPDLNPLGRGYFSEHWSPGSPTVAYVGTVAFGLTLYEVLDEVEVVYVEGGEKIRAETLSPAQRRRSHISKAHMPSGRFALRLYSPYHLVKWEQEWRESKPGSLPRSIPDIANVLEARAPVLAKQFAEAEQQAEIQRRADEERWQRQMREYEEREREEARKKSRASLLAVIDEWAQACRVEDFLRQVAESASITDEVERARILALVEGARDLLGTTDALARFRAWQPPGDNPDSE